MAKIQLPKRVWVSDLAGDGGDAEPPDDRHRDAGHEGHAVAAGGDPAHRAHPVEEPGQDVAVEERGGRRVGDVVEDVGDLRAAGDERG